MGMIRQTSQRSKKTGAKRKPGKRGPKMPRGRLVQQLEEKAYELVEREGAAALTARNLAEKVKVFHTLVTYYFGSMIGLLAAVAARGFEQLAQHLARAGEAQVKARAVPATVAHLLALVQARGQEAGRVGGGAAVREPRAQLVGRGEIPFREEAHSEIPMARLDERFPPAAEMFLEERPSPVPASLTATPASSIRARFEPLIQVALAHLRFGLDHPNLYLAMHEPRLWEQIALIQENPRSAEIHEKTRPYLQRVFVAREKGFQEYLRAVDANHSGLASSDVEQRWRLARLVAVIIDGYLFQVNCEHLHHRDRKRQHEERIVSFLEYPLLGALQRSGEASR